MELNPSFGSWKIEDHKFFDIVEIKKDLEIFLAELFVVYLDYGEVHNFMSFEIFLMGYDIFSKRWKAIAVGLRKSETAGSKQVRKVPSEGRRREFSRRS
ncbi:hypothetical protein NPIL_586471 [Nephila pilipes]|uniref:Uncharacterized protein n=1 Tax=Nephila pilipes TaxID=299642 RepID=A0A8X6M5G1_NEPPI|nr:hypothetical protein NPIL_586471 [Nephila pilipes]